MRATLIGRRALNATVTTFHVRPEQPVAFLAGQYIDLIVPHDRPDDRGTHRWLTISNAPGSDHIELTSRLPRKAPSSYKRALHALKDESRLELGEVLGDFVAPKDRRIPLVFIADGIGVTPFISIVRDLRNSGDKRDIRLYHSVRHASDLLFHDEFEAYGVTISNEIILPRSSGLPATLCSELSALAGDSLFYLAGSEQRCLAIQQYLKTEGVPPMRIALDYFTGYQAA